ncbi:MAG: hypothetical protein IT449_05430 [Phycisphaerales bacterium]|nr:hypothetical protein [Phycisphaerales bacterium]
MPVPQSDRMTVHCTACSAKLAVPAAAVGKKVKCPKCGDAFTILPAEPLPEPQGPSMLEDLVAEANSASAIERPQPIEAPIPRPAALGGRPAKSAQTSAATGVAGKLAKGAGKFMLGCIFSFIGAIVGAGLWCAIAVGTGVELGYVAWGLGVLAGLGMYLGYRTKNVRAGVTAAGISLVGVIGAKVFIFSYFVYGAVTGNTSNIDLQRVYVASARAMEIIEEQGVTDPNAPGFDAKWEEAYGQAQRETQRLTDAQVRERCRNYRQMEREAEARLAAGDHPTSSGEAASGQDASGEAAPGKSTDGSADSADEASFEDEGEFAEASEAEDSEAAAALGSAFVSFLKESFSPIDLLFVALAVMSAFRIGSGNVGGS